METENFDKIPEEKRRTVVNAALACFGKDGYKKTAISEIAEKAGISKASVFHYFGTKKDLYTYLFRLSCDEILAEMTEGSEDFIDCLRTGTLVKMRVMNKHPGMYDFLLSLVKEKDESVIRELGQINTSAIKHGLAMLFANVDWGRFKPDYDRETVMNLARWVSDGCIKHFSETRTGDEISTELDRYMAIVRKALYKEEYL